MTETISKNFNVFLLVGQTLLRAHPKTKRQAIESLQIQQQRDRLSAVNQAIRFVATARDEPSMTALLGKKTELKTCTF